jgi:hypothetical protein
MVRMPNQADILGVIVGAVVALIVLWLVWLVFTIAV